MSVVGEIKPGSTDKEPPVFRVIHNVRDPAFRDSQATEVRSCEHGAFILDEKWLTVTCGRCKERVEPFAALLNFAAWAERWEQYRKLYEEAEKSLLFEQVRALSDRRCLTDEERKGIKKWLHGTPRWNASLEEVRKYRSELEDRVKERARR